MQLDRADPPRQARTSLTKIRRSLDRLSWVRPSRIGFIQISQQELGLLGVMLGAGRTKVDTQDVAEQRITEAGLAAFYLPIWIGNDSPPPSPSDGLALATQEVFATSFKVGVRL